MNSVKKRCWCIHFLTDILKSFLIDSHELYIICTMHEKGPYEISGQCRPRSACLFTQADMGTCCPLTESMATVIYVEEQRMLRSDCRGALWSGSSVFPYDIRAFFHMLCIIKDVHVHWTLIVHFYITHLNVFEKLEVSALGYICHTQPDRIHLVMDISQTMAYLK